MNLKKNHYSRRALALLLTLVMCVGMIPTAFAAQQNSYHDPAEHWMQASGRTNELDANSVVTRETFKCGECGKATSFEVFRVPEYTRNGQPALSRNVKYSDGTTGKYGSDEIGISRIGEEWITKYRAQGGRGHYTANMTSLVYYNMDGSAKNTFKRILIKRRSLPNEDRAEAN